jgi:ribosomal protein S19
MNIYRYRTDRITQFEVGKFIFIWNGKGYKKLFIHKEMIGFLYREFVLTKKIGRFIHRVKKKR